MLVAIECQVETGGVYTLSPSAAAGAAAAAGAGAGDAEGAVDAFLTLNMSAYESREHFKFLTCSSCYQLQGVDDVEAFDATLTAMRTLGIPQQSIQDVCDVVAAVLCLGNVSFTALDSDTEASDVSAAALPYLEKAAKMLGVEPEALKEAMCYRTIKTARESLRKPMRQEEATEMRCALSAAAEKKPIGPASSKKKSFSQDLLFCGVLDIFGFECFPHNSFEQLCINFANERLQQFFNSFVFLCEEQLYQKEQIHWCPLDFPNNADCVALLQDKYQGVFALLDEECVVPGGSNRGYSLKLAKKEQLHTLMETIGETSPHFIRCIKPNPQNLPDVFHRPSVNEQLRYGGPPGAPPQGGPQGATWAVGATLCFFKRECFELLSSALVTKRAAASTRIQACFRGFQQRKAYMGLRRDTVIIQRAVREWLQRRERERQHRNEMAIKIQNFMKMVGQRKKYLRVLRGIVRLQALVRGRKARAVSLCLRENRAAALIQASWRMKQQRQSFTKLKKAAILAQLRWKRLLAIRQLRHLKAEARDVAGLVKLVQARADELQKQLQQAKKEVADLKAELKANAGPANVGKRELLKALVEKLGDRHALQQLQAPAEAEGSFEQLVKVKEPGGPRLVCLCFTYDGSPQCLEVLRQRVQQSFVVCLVFDPLRQSTYNACLSLLRGTALPAIKEAQSPELPGTQVFFIENNWGASASRDLIEVDIQTARDAVASLGCHYKALMHLSSLYDDLRPWLQTLAAYRRSKPEALRPLNSSKSQSFSPSQGLLSGGGLLRSSGSFPAALVDTIRSFIATGKGSYEATKRSIRISQELQFLLPSVPVADNQMPVLQGPCDGVVPVVEVVPTQLEEREAVTCLTFGAERERRDFILLAVARKNGYVVVYRCYRTNIEKEALDPHDVRSLNADENSIPGEAKPRHVKVNRASPLPETLDKITVHSEMVGHVRAVTSMFFSLLEDFLVTTSIDLTIRFWAVDSGANVKVFADSAAPLAAALLPFNPSVFIASNSNSLLRLVCSNTGKVLQKMKMESEVRAIRFDDTGLFCFAGNKAGQLCVLEASDNATLTYKYKLNISKGAITCITFVPSRSPRERPLVIANCCDSNVAVVECVYGMENGSLSNLQVCRRLKMQHELLPLRNCFLPTGGGWLVSGCEDMSVFCFPLREHASAKSGFHLSRHSNAVLAVAVNAQSTLLASADSGGTVILWRRLAATNAT
ncbi:myosin f [Cyclospora cayetanensis]|uniref:Myosin f n=1 Tax=Cyclospora cayetanensis TaxID=88456 RepID=A0A1D3CXD7_9EIME|nr:myosin f [Cyclospora cayetanensis]